MDESQRVDLKTRMLTQWDAVAEDWIIYAGSGQNETLWTSGLEIAFGFGKMLPGDTPRRVRHQENARVPASPQLDEREGDGWKPRC